MSESRLITKPAKAAAAPRHSEPPRAIQVSGPGSAGKVPGHGGRAGLSNPSRGPQRAPGAPEQGLNTQAEAGGGHGLESCGASVQALQADGRVPGSGAHAPDSQLRRG